jgi:hypothetical protein
MGLFRFFAAIFATGLASVFAAGGAGFAFVRAALGTGFTREGGGGKGGEGEDG